MSEGSAERDTRRAARRAGVIALCREHDALDGHAAQVARLAEQLRAQIAPPAKHAFRPGPIGEWLEYAAFLHDIGYIVDIRKHHKHGARIVRSASLPGMLPQEMTLLALTVRCHRKSWPGRAHKAFAGIGEADYRTVRWLAALLRIADGLDRTHRNVVRRIEVTNAAHSLDIGLTTRGRAQAELWAARRKSDLLASVLKRPVLFRVMKRETPWERDEDHGKPL